MERKVYMDNAATTRVKMEVIEEMNKYLNTSYGNPSSIYVLGQTSRKAINKSRNTIASFLNANNDEIFFTSCGTESDNWAVKGVAYANRKKGNHIITTKIEHHAILHTCEYLQKQGFEVTYLDVDEYGIVNLEQLKDSIKDETILISIMYANNEIGTIQPIEEIGKIAKENGIIFHTDAVQALGSVKIDVKKLNIDLLSMSAHKIYGPKGIGALYIKKGIKIDNFMHGGAQESKKRAGTESIHNIVGFGKAVELVAKNFDEHISKLALLRDKMIKEISERIADVKLNGHETKRLPNNVNFSFNFIEGESLLLYLDMEGISASSGSACTSGSLDPSHVLMSIGLKHEMAHGSLRFSLGDFNSEEDVDYVIEKLIGIVNKLRAISPLKA